MLQVEKSLGCEFCSATFHTQEMFNIHNRLHAKRSLMCIICKAVFSTMASMRVHLWKAHAISKADQQRSIASLDWAADSFAPTKESKTTTPFKYCRCNKSFKYKFSIARHLRLHRKKGELFGGINSTQQIIDSTSHGQINSGPLGDIESAEPQAINNRIATTSEDPNSPESSESITLNLSVDDKGPATHQGDLQDDARSYHHLNKKHNSVQRYKCCHCGALFRFDFSYEAHMRQHNMMDT